MKKVLILVLFSILIFALNAQIGIFNLTYDTSHSETIENLNLNGFIVYDTEENLVSLYDSTNVYVGYITLRFNKTTDTLDEWFVAYTPQSEEDIEEVALNAVKSYHEDWDDYDEVTEIYTWDLSDTRYILAGFDTVGDYFWVEYRSTAYDAERAANSDDYYYYDDDEYWDY